MTVKASMVVSTVLIVVNKVSKVTSKVSNIINQASNVASKVSNVACSCPVCLVDALGSLLVMRQEPTIGRPQYSYSSSYC